MILTRHLTEQGQIWQKFLPLATLVYNTFNSPNLGNYSPYELVFGRKPKVLLDLETDPDIKVSGTYKDYYTLLNKRLKYLQEILQPFKSKWLVMINKNCESFQYNSGDLVYIISPLTSLLRTAPRKVAIKYEGPLAIYKIVDPHHYLLVTLDRKILRGLFEHERLKPTTIRTSDSNINSLVQLKQVLTLGIVIQVKEVCYLKPPLGTETDRDFLLLKKWKNIFLYNIHFTHLSNVSLLCFCTWNFRF